MLDTATIKLIAAYDEYIEELCDHEATLLSMAANHGYKTPPRLIKKGEELREKIKQLKEKIGA